MSNSPHWTLLKSNRELTDQTYKCTQSPVECIAWTIFFSWLIHIVTSLSWNICKRFDFYCDEVTEINPECRQNWITLESVRWSIIIVSMDWLPPSSHLLNLFEFLILEHFSNSSHFSDISKLNNFQWIIVYVQPVTSAAVCATGMQGSMPCEYERFVSISNVTDRELDQRQWPLLIFFYWRVVISGRLRFRISRLKEFMVQHKQGWYGSTWKFCVESLYSILVWLMFS